MGHVFISYKREDASAVERLVLALRGAGLDVWWDHDIPPEASWETTIETALFSASAVVVCWSKAAVASDNVKSEARWARNRNKLLQIYMDACDPPLFFGERQGVDLAGWKGAGDAPCIQKVVAALNVMLSRDPTATGGTATAHDPRKAGRTARWLVGAVLLVALAGLGTLAASWRPAVKAAAVVAAPEVAEKTRLLAQISGSWGRDGCATPYLYTVVGDRIHVTTQGYESEGRVVSATAGVVLSEALSPKGDKGKLVELRPEDGQLVLQDRTNDVRMVLVRCP